MIDIAVAYNRYKFLGYEFLTWLWCKMDRDRENLSEIDPDLTSLEIGNRVGLENRSQTEKETITIRGDAAGFEEGMLALEKGAMVAEMNLILKSNENEWRFTLKGENLDVSGMKTPETAGMESSDDMDAAVLEKVFLYDKVFRIIDGLFARFIRIRLSEEWQNETVPEIKKWIHKRAK